MTSHPKLPDIVERLNDLLAITFPPMSAAIIEDARNCITRLRASPPTGWREGIEAAAKVAKFYALDQESCERLQAETICYVIHDAIRALVHPGDKEKG